MADIRELAALIEQFTGTDGVHTTPLPRLFLHRSSAPSAPVHTVYEPAFCIIAQGSKQAVSGDQIYVYDASKYLVVSVDVPIVAHITDASASKPFLGLRIDLDPAAIGALMMESDVKRAATAQPGPSLGVSDLSTEIIDAAVRLLRLLASPRDIPILAPLAEREILYRLLRGEQTARLSQIAFAESKLQQVNRAIGWIKRNFREPFRMELIVDAAGMSASALHQHFKTVTGMSPLQYQKQLRLQEARTLILLQSVDAATAGHAVGYDSPSQFSREYRRMFGAPPLRDAERLRGVLSEAPV
ncbi:AraC family transcriptional regulator [Hyphomicrobium sp. CS1GBMeth3]|uniref:AraC family transcriptional regulator n=1 Tax=Hyphomicrobium sp. CS1GBMeth3 TaxID=1892845 RepID=UPI00093008DD|nr:AraC family transcriptional regulator [Hyphomicrobium sp. CS1GBMeth3]